MTARSTTIEPAKSFSLKATALSHGWHECSPLSWSEGGRCLQLIEGAKGQACRVSVTEHAAPVSNRRPTQVANRCHTLNITVEDSATDARFMDDTVKRVSLSLGVDRDLSEFYSLCRKHPALAVIPRIGAGRLIRSTSMAENILKTLCATNVNWTQAVKMINRLGQLGPNVRHFRQLNAWPTPREILRAGEGYLKDVCRLGYRTESILTFCRSVCEGRFDPETLTKMAADDGQSSDDILTQLRGIKGIGPSSAHFLLSLLGRYDRLAIDSATVAHVAHTHTNGRKPSHKQIERIYAPFGKWRNLVCWCENWLTWDTAKQILQEAGLSSG